MGTDDRQQYPYRIVCQKCGDIGGARTQTSSEDRAWAHHQMHARDGQAQQVWIEDSRSTTAVPAPLVIFHRSGREERV